MQKIAGQTKAQLSPDEVQGIIVNGGVALRALLQSLILCVHRGKTNLASSFSVRSRCNLPEWHNWLGHLLDRDRQGDDVSVVRLLA